MTIDLQSQITDISNRLLLVEEKNKTLVEFISFLLEDLAEENPNKFEDLYYEFIEGQE